MANVRDRRLSRERALQILFGADFIESEADEVLQVFWEHTAANPEVRSYAEFLVRGVFMHKDELDQGINAALHTWTPDRIGRIERALLRMAFFELLYSEDVPVSVTINEAIEIEKKFGEEEAAPFIHAVLDRLAKQKQTTYLES